MINFASLKFKIIAATILIAGLVGGGIFAKSWYNSKIDAAREEGRQEINSLAQEYARETIEKELSENNKRLKQLNSENRQLRGQLQSLEKMLLIDHDLDRLLQSKPDMIINRINSGTEEVFKELEEATK